MGKNLDPVSLDEKPFRDMILNEMNDDDVKRAVERDTLIKEFGRRLHEKHPEPQKKNYIVNKLRELGRFLVEGKKVNSWSSLEDSLDPKKI